LSSSPKTDENFLSPGDALMMHHEDEAQNHRIDVVDEKGNLMKMNLHIAYMLQASPWAPLRRTMDGHNFCFIPFTLRVIFQLYKD
jgi:hypothetical protein